MRNFSTNKKTSKKIANKKLYQTSDLNETSLSKLLIKKRNKKKNPIIIGG